MTRLVLIALPLAAAFAQQFEPFDATERQASAKAAQWMQSPGYREKAWGAYLAGKYRLQCQSASLVSQLEALRELAGDGLHVDSPEFGAIQATLDALIELGHPVDAANLLPLQKQWADEVLILLAQDPQANREPLLAMAGNSQRDPFGTLWVATHNLLVEARSAGIAALVLSEVNISHVFHVIDSSGFGPGAGSGHGGGVLDFMAGDFAPGFPPIGVYELLFSPQTGDVIAAPGTHPVYYHRSLLNARRGGTFVPLDRQEYRLEYLAQLSYLPLRAIQEALAASTVIRWRSASDYRSQVETALSAQRTGIERLLEKLRSAGVLAPDEADALELRILIEQDDQRKGGPALPNLLPVPALIGGWVYNGCRSG